MFTKILRYIVTIIILLIIILLLIYGVSKSDFTNLKKYDEIGNGIGNVRSEMHAPSKEKLKFAKARYYTTKVKIKDGSMANLGDFTLNISDNRKLITNISLKFKDKKSNSWLSGDSVEDEILEKGDILRSVVINTFSGSQTISASDNLSKQELVKNINNNLSNGEVEEVYFNRFIVQ